MPIGHGPLRYASIKAVALFLDLITPASFIYLSLFINTTNTGSSFFLHLFLPLYCSIEVLFLVHYTLEKKRLQNVNVNAKCPDQKQRAILFKRILSDITTPMNARKFLVEWFMFENTKTQLKLSELSLIKRENLFEWFAWSFFCLDFNGRNMHEFNDTIKLELNTMLQKFEHKMKLELEDGYTNEISAIKLNYNDVEAYHKPFFLYAIIFMLESLGFFALRIMGFKHHVADALCLPDQNSYLSSYHFSYYARCKKSNTSTPLVFFHGIGGGLFCYVVFIYKLICSVGNGRNIFLVELPHVSMKLLGADMVPAREEVVEEVIKMLHVHDSGKKAVFIGHSLGTAYCSWMVKYSNLSAGVVLIDPICFKLYDPALVFQFVHRIPKNTPELIIHSLVSRELNISHYISRHFCWWENVLFPQDLKNIKTSTPRVFIGRKDSLINGKDVHDYLEKYQFEDEGFDGGSRKNPITIKGETWNIDHAEFLLTPEKENRIVEHIAEVFKELNEDDGIDYKSMLRSSNRNVGKKTSTRYLIPVV